MNRTQHWLATLLLLSSTAGAAELELLLHQRPPYQTIAADGTVEGLLAPAVEALIRAGLADHVTVMPAKRQLEIIRGGKQRACALGWFQLPERTAFARFSRAIYQDQPAVLVASTRLQMPARSALAAFFALPGPRLLAQDSFSYGATTDVLLVQHALRVERTGSPNIAMIDMVAAGRVDAALIQREEAGALAAQRRDVRIIELTDTGPGNSRHWMCSKAVSAKTMRAIDRALKNSGRPSGH